MQQILSEIADVTIFIGDIAVIEESDETHLNLLKQVLESLC